MSNLVKQSSHQSMHCILEGLANQIHNDFNAILKPFFTLSKPKINQIKKVTVNKEYLTNLDVSGLVSRSIRKISDAELQLQNKLLLAEVDACLESC
jgi:hypothetical protein